MRVSTFLLFIIAISFMGCNSVQELSPSHETRALTKTKSLLNFEIVDIDADRSIDQVYIYTYDEKSNLVKKEFEFILDQHYVYRAYMYTYDDYSNKIQETIKDQFGNILYNGDYYYDEKSNLSYINIDTDNDLMVDIMYRFTYDANEKLIKKESDYDADGLTDYINEYYYDENGILAQELLYKQNDPNSTISTFYTYDQNLNLIKKEQDYNNDHIMKYATSYTYDQNNTLIQEFYSSKNIQNSFKYFYDQNKNLTKKEQYNSNNELINIVTYLY